MSTILLLWIRFALFRFQSPLLTESLLLSLPVATKMFQFTTLLHQNKLVRNPKVSRSRIKESPHQHSHAVTRGLSQLATPFISSQAKPFTKRRLTTSSVKVFFLYNSKKFLTIFFYLVRLLLCTTRDHNSMRESLLSKTIGSESAFYSEKIASLQNKEDRQFLLLTHHQKTN